MSYTEMRNVILYKYHKDIQYWWQLVGEMFEGVNGWTKSYEVKRRLDTKLVTIVWDRYSWYIR